MQLLVEYDENQCFERTGQYILLQQWELLILISDIHLLQGFLVTAQKANPTLYLWSITDRHSHCVSTLETPELDMWVPPFDWMF